VARRNHAFVRIQNISQLGDGLKRIGLRTPVFHLEILNKEFQCRSVLLSLFLK